MTGNVLIHSNQNRLTQYYVWTFGPGNDTYYKFLYIDFAASPDKVRRLAVWRSGSVVRRIDQVTPCRSRLGTGDRLRAGIPPRYGISQLGQLSLASLWCRRNMYQFPLEVQAGMLRLLGGRKIRT